jgi:hypothetical protein
LFCFIGFQIFRKKGDCHLTEQELRAVLISLTFGVSEIWLKDGTGNMFFTTSSEKLQRLTSLFNELPPRFQDYVMIQIEQLLSVIEKET